MQTTILGSTGVEVSRLCFGTMSFGGEADEAESRRLYARCREVGINFFDCADIYNRGRAEEILGRLIASERERVVITSKAHAPMSDDVLDRGCSRLHLTRAVEASLRRLNTDRIDFFFLHQFDARTPMEESLRALDDLVRSGKIVYPAVSNWAAWQIARALGRAELHRWAPLALVQPMYSLVKRQAEVEILPLAQSEKLGVIPYSPLAGGLLSGKYRDRDTPGRFRDNPMYEKRFGQAHYFETADALSALAAELNEHPATIAVSWVMTHPAVTAPILGARDVAQLEPSLRAADFVMDEALRARISALSPTPPPAHDRSEQQK